MNLKKKKAKKEDITYQGLVDLWNEATKNNETTVFLPVYSLKQVEMLKKKGLLVLFDRQNNSVEPYP